MCTCAGGACPLPPPPQERAPLDGAAGRGDDAIGGQGPCPPKAANDVGTKSVTHGNEAIEVAVQAVNDVLSSARRMPSSAIAPSAERRNSRQARTAQQGPQRDEDPRSWRVAPDGWGEGVGVIPTASTHAEFVRREAARLAAASSRPLISSSAR